MGGSGEDGHVSFSFPFTKRYPLHFLSTSTGLSPTFSFMKRDDGSSPSQPTIHELGGAGNGQGWYYFDWTFNGPSDLDVSWTVGSLADPTTLDEGIIAVQDLVDVFGTAPQTHRYKFHYLPTDTGLTPAFSLCKRLDTGADLVPPTIHELGGGWYYFDWNFSTSGDPDICFVINGDAPGAITIPHTTFGLTMTADVYSEPGPLPLPAPVIPSIRASSKAREALAQQLRRLLPAEILSLNSQRAAVLLAGVAGPYTIPAGPNNILKVGPGGAEVSVTLTPGVLTAAQVAAAINAVPVAGINAAFDGVGRLMIVSTTTPSVAGGPSTVSVLADAGNGPAGINAVFGWDTGGQEIVNSALVAPQYNGVADGWPQTNTELGPGLWVILADSSEKPRSPWRSHVYHCTINIEIAWQDPSNQISKNKEPIGRCLQAVRECILADRTLGGAVFLTETNTGDIKGVPLQWKGGSLFDGALLVAKVHVFEDYVP